MNRWVAGARPRTLPAAGVPVLVGTACAAGDGDVVPWRAVAAMVASVAIQVGTNYVNDYADGVRGTDAQRVGPVRLVASGLATPSAVKKAALASFGVAAVAGLALAIAVGWELLVVGAASFAAGYLYTGGPAPYGYSGLGEVFVFLFFGVVATAGTAYVQLEEVQGLARTATPGSVRSSSSCSSAWWPLPARPTCRPTRCRPSRWSRPHRWGRGPPPCS